MNTSPIPPGTLSTAGVFGTIVLAVTGKFDNHPGWLCVALAIIAAVAVARGFTEAWKTVRVSAAPKSDTPTESSKAAVVAVLLLSFLTPSIVLADDSTTAVKVPAVIALAASEPPMLAPTRASVVAPAVETQAPTTPPSVPLLIPPEAVVPPACPEPCAACAARVGGALTPAGQPMPTWLKVVLGVGVALGGALTIYQQGHAAGTW